MNPTVGSIAKLVALLLGYLLYAESAVAQSDRSLLDRLPNKPGVYISIKDLSQTIELLVETIAASEEDCQRIWEAPAMWMAQQDQDEFLRTCQTSFDDFSRVAEQLRKEHFGGEALLVGVRTGAGKYTPVFLLELDDEEDGELEELLSEGVRLLTEGSDEVDWLAKTRNVYWAIEDGVFVATQSTTLLQQYSELIRSENPPEDPLVETRDFQLAMAHQRNISADEVVATVFVSPSACSDLVRGTARLAIGLEIPEDREFATVYALDDFLSLGATLRRSSESDSKEVRSAPLVLDAYLLTAQPGKGIGNAIDTDAELNFQMPTSELPLAFLFVTNLDPPSLRSFFSRLQGIRTSSFHYRSKVLRGKVPYIHDEIFEVVDNCLGFTHFRLQESQDLLSSTKRRSFIRLSQSDRHRELADAFYEKTDRPHATHEVIDKWQAVHDENGLVVFELSDEAVSAVESAGGYDYDLIANQLEILKSVPEEDRDADYQRKYASYRETLSRLKQRRVHRVSQLRVVFNSWLVLGSVLKDEVEYWKHSEGPTPATRQLQIVRDQADQLSKQHDFRKAPHFVCSFFAADIVGLLQFMSPIEAKKYFRSPANELEDSSKITVEASQMISCLRIRELVLRSLLRNENITFAGERHEDGIHIGAMIGRRSEPFRIRADEEGLLIEEIDEADE